MAAANQAPPPSKPPPPARSVAASGAKSPTSSSLSSHFAMIELKQRILTSIAKLSDRDTHHLALAELHATVAAASPDSVPMLLNCLYDAAADPHSKPPVRKDALSLLALLAAARPDPVAAHLPRIVAAVVRRLKDPDSAVRDACRDALGALSAQYLRGGGGEASAAVSIFVKPLFEALNEQNKVVQSGAAACLAKVVECAHEPPVAAFQKLCPRVCKCLRNPNFLGKASLLSVVSSLSQVKAPILSFFLFDDNSYVLLIVLMYIDMDLMCYIASSSSSSST